MIVITGAMMAAGAAAGGSSALKAVGNYYKNRDKISRQNKQIARAERKDIQGWLGQMQQYAAYNKAQLDQFEADIANLNQQYEFNGSARQEAIDAGLTQLADISDGFIERAFARNMKAAEASGKFLASGQTGRTTKRMEGLATKAVQGRGLAADAGSMERAVGAFMFREKEAKFQQEVANQNAFNQVRKPVFGPGPVAPQSRTRPADNTFRDLAFGVGSAVAGGFLGQFQQEQALNIFQQGSKLPAPTPAPVSQQVSSPSTFNFPNFAGAGAFQLQGAGSLGFFPGYNPF